MTNVIENFFENFTCTSQFQYNISYERNFPNRAWESFKKNWRK